MTSLVQYPNKLQGITYASPESPYTVRFVTGRSNKVIQGIRLDNFATEIIANYPNRVTVGETVITDPVSVRVRVSGAPDSRKAIKAVIEALSAQLTIWESESVYLGFQPTTAPTLPTFTAG